MPTRNTQNNNGHQFREPISSSSSSATPASSNASSNAQSTFGIEDWKRQTTSDINYYRREECPIDDRLLIDSHPVRVSINNNHNSAHSLSSDVKVKRLSPQIGQNEDINGRYIGSNKHQHYRNQYDDEDNRDTSNLRNGAAWHYTYHQNQYPQQQQQMQQREYQKDYHDNHSEIHHNIPAFIVSNDFEPDEGFSTFLQPKNHHQHHLNKHEQKKEDLLRIIPQMSKEQVEETVSILEADPLRPHNNSNISQFTREQQRRLAQPQTILASLFEGSSSSSNNTTNNTSSKGDTTLFGFNPYQRDQNLKPQQQQPSPAQPRFLGKAKLADKDMDDFKDDMSNNTNKNNSLTDLATNWVRDTHKTWLENRDKANGPHHYPTANLLPYTSQGTKSNNTEIIGVYVSPSNPRYNDIVSDLSSKQAQNPRVGIDHPPHYKPAPKQTTTKTTTDPYDMSRVAPLLGDNERVVKSLVNDYPAVSQTKRTSNIVNRNLLQRNYGLQNLSSDIVHDQYLSPFHPSLKSEEYEAGRPTISNSSTLSSLSTHESRRREQQQQQQQRQNEYPTEFIYYEERRYDNNDGLNNQFTQNQNKTKPTSFSFSKWLFGSKDNKDDNKFNTNEFISYNTTNTTNVTDHQQDDLSHPAYYITGASYDIIPSQHLVTKTQQNDYPKTDRRALSNQISEIDLNPNKNAPKKPIDRHLAQHFEKEHDEKVHQQLDETKNKSLLDIPFYSGMELINKASEAITTWNSRPKDYWSNWFGGNKQQRDTKENLKLEQQQQHQEQQQRFQQQQQQNQSGDETSMETIIRRGQI